MNVQEQVARLEALLTRIQHNGAALRRERGTGELEMKPHSTPVETPRAAASPHGTPTKLLPTSIEAAEAAPPRTAPPPKPSSIPAAAATLIPVSNEPLEADFTGPEIADGGFEREESIEQTKPLWVGLSEPAPHLEDPVTLPPAAFTPVRVSTGPSLPPLPDDTLEPAPQAFEPVQAPESLDADLRDSSPPLSGERASTRSPSLPPQDGPMSLEEPLASAVGAQIPMTPPGFDSDAESAVAISTAPLDDAESFVEDRESRISDAPASVLGATITLPDDDVGEVELELAEPPPSSLRAIAPNPEHELEADLPRTSYRAGYDDSLSSPPLAREELIAHDLSVRERVSSAPAPSLTLSEAPASEVTHPAYSAPSESELPPVLSSRPHSPVTIPPQSAVEPLRASANRQEETSFDAPYESYEAAERPAFDAVLTDEAHRSIPPYQTSVSDVVVSARPAPHAVEFAPPAHAVAATFAGAVPSPRDASFLELLDTSLSLEVRG